MSETIRTRIRQTYCTFEIGGFIYHLLLRRNCSTVPIRNRGRQEPAPRRVLPVNADDGYGRVSSATKLPW